MKSYLILAAFISAIVYIADAIGTQSETLFIKSLAVNHQMSLRKYFFKELQIEVIIALVCDLCLSLIALL